MRRTITIAALMLTAALACCCKDGIKPVKGTMDGPIVIPPAPAKVHEAMPLAYMERYENIFRDNENGVSVWSLVNCNPEVSSEGYGIHVIKDKVVSYFPDIYHGNNPHASYDPAAGDLWLACGVMEGTGVEVEKPYLIRFKEDNSAFIAREIDPFTLQELLIERLGGKTCGKRITLYDNGRKIAVAKNTVTGMGGFDSDNPLWVGEQIRFKSEGDGLHVIFTPGIKYTTGLVLTYDDMPDLCAKITLEDDENITLGDISVCGEPNPGEPR